MQFSFHSSTETDGAQFVRSLPVSTWRVPALIALFLLVMAVGFHLIAAYIGEEGKLLAAEGVEAEAVVIDHRVEQKLTRDNDDDQQIKTSFYVEYRFVTASGETVEVEKSVSAAQFNSQEVGTKVSIRYVPSSPKITEFEKGSRESEAGALGWVSKALGALALVMAGVAVYVRRKLSAAS